MPCARCAKWIVSTFVCNDCAFVFKVKHRDKGDLVTSALRRNASCSNCGSTDFEILE